MSSIMATIGRFLIAITFVVSGITKLLTVGATEMMMQRVNLPAGLAIPTGLFELIAGLMLALGIIPRLVSLLLIGFVLLSTLFFHNQFTDPEQAAHVLKNLAIVGGLFAVMGTVSLRSEYADLRVQRERAQAEHAAMDRVVDAEVRAARAEAAASSVSPAIAPPPPRRWFGRR